MNHLDIRLPIGMLFTLLGLLLTGYGLVSDASVYQRSLGHNLNLSWGVVVLVFGAVFLFYGRRGTAAALLATESPEGRATEAREHRTGLESEAPEAGGD
jgi:hypothetical protein